MKAALIMKRHGVALMNRKWKRRRRLERETK
jgi:hypothetical protein